MIDLVRFFFNPFDDERISQAEIETFTIHHIAAMVANNGAGTLSTLITQTTNLSTTYGQSLSSEVVLLGVQKARVQAKDLFRQNLAEELGKIYGMVTGRFGKKGVKTTEIFPGGLSLYSDCEDALLGTNLDALHTALNANVAELGSTPINLADTQKTQWATIFNDASTGKAGHNSGRATVRNADQALRDQLYKNLHQCAILFPGDEAKAHQLFPQHHLENPETTPTPTPTPPPTPTPTPTPS